MITAAFKPSEGEFNKYFKAMFQPISDSDKKLYILTAVLAYDWTGLNQSESVWKVLLPETAVQKTTQPVTEDKPPSRPAL